MLEQIGIANIVSSINYGGLHEETYRYLRRLMIFDEKGSL